MNDGGYMAVSPLSSNIVFATGNVYNAGYFLGITLTTDGGATWGHDTLVSATRGWAVAFDPIDSNRVYVGGDSAYSYPALLITTDLGVTWTMSHTGLNGTVNALATVPGGQLALRRHEQRRVHFHRRRRDLVGFNTDPNGPRAGG